MNNMMMPFILLLAGGQGKNQAGAVQAMLTASNLLPEAPRTILAVTEELNRADQTAAEKAAVVRREEALAELIVDSGGFKVIKDLSEDPRMRFMVSRLSNQGLRDRVTKALKQTKNS